MNENHRKGRVTIETAPLAQHAVSFVENEMEETEGEFLDEEKFAGEETDEEGSSKQPGEAYDDLKPPLSLTPTTSQESGLPSPKHQNWKEIHEGLWVMGGEEGLMAEGYNEDTSDVAGPCKSETEETFLPDSRERSNDVSATSSEALSNVYSKLSPFTIQWSFGINRSVDIINLTTAESFEVFYVAGHFGVIYNYGTDTMTFLPGHNYPITSTASDTTGRWLVTADAGEDTVIIIWDRKKKVPAWSLYNVFPGGVQCTRISQDARFLAAVNCNPPFAVKFWLWTYGRHEPDGELEIHSTEGRPKDISFNHLQTEQFALTMEFRVTFLEWKKETKTIESYTPKYDKKKLGNLRQSIFLDDNHTVLSSTSQGYIVVWSDVKYTEVTVPEVPGTVRREFLKGVRLHKSGIASLRLCDGIVATVSEDGTILFHDQQCRLMYWGSKMQVAPVVSISFNIEHIYCSADPFSMDTVSSSGNEEVQNVLEYDSSFEKQNSTVTEFTDSEALTEDKCNDDIPQPLDCTLEMKPIFVRDFMFLTMYGQLGYISHRRSKVKYYLNEIQAPILSMDCNPTKPHLVMGNDQGGVVLYEYNLKKKLISVTFQSAITTLQYSSFGHILIAGLQTGDLLVLDSLLLSIKFKLDTSKVAIGKLCFSPRDDLIAFYDLASTVQVYGKKPATDKWISMGRYVSHYKPILDILFTKHKEDHKLCRLFTIGQDRMLVEYDMKNLEENKLKILTTMRIEQTAIPLCFISLESFYNSPHFLFSNDQYKLKLVDADTFNCEKTTLGPTADTPIKFMKIIMEQESQPDKAKMVYTTDKHIGIRILPPTGNPFEGMGMIAHTEKITAIAVSHNHKYIFTVGVNDMSPLMWEVNPGSVDVACHLGGNELEPFVSLIEGGPNSFLFKELEDFFYYAQIIHQGEDPNLDRSVSKHLALCEIPDLFRALGYYPTDYEVNNLLHELKHLDYEKTGRERTEVTFEECVKAFLNHRPVEGTSLEDINNALLAIADLSDPSDIIIERTELYKALEEKAESMEHAEVLGYLCILLLPQDENNPVPHNLCLNEFAETVLGIDLKITEENVRQITHAFEANSGTA